MPKCASSIKREGERKDRGTILELCCPRDKGCVHTASLSAQYWFIAQIVGFFQICCSDIFLNVANIRFQMVQMVRKNNNKDFPRSTMLYDSKHGGHWSQRFMCHLGYKLIRSVRQQIYEQMITRMRMKRKRDQYLIMAFCEAIATTLLWRCDHIHKSRKWWQEWLQRNRLYPKFQDVKGYF